MSLKAGGVALNLTCANYIYLMDPGWNPAAEMYVYVPHRILLSHTVLSLTIIRLL